MNHENQKKELNNKNIKKTASRRKKNKEADILTQKGKNLRNRETNIISFIFVGVFLSMIAYLVYFNVLIAPGILNSPYNKRVDNQEIKVVRGDILSADGEILATTKTDEDGNEYRYYPYENAFCHVIGLASAKTGVEGAANYNLLSESGNVMNQLTNDLSGEKAVGNKVITTLDTSLQETAYKALGKNKGAVIVMEPSTGKILAMVSSPSYNPNDAPTEYNNWLSYESSDSVLLNRATQGKYPPGSTFKILTAIEYIRENNGDDSFSFDCTGSGYVNGGTRIPCFGNSVHGNENLKQAFANSCNSAFSTIGTQLNNQSFRKLVDSFLFNENPPIDIESSKGNFTLDESSGISEQQETAIGQGKTMITPLHDLLMASTVANNGIMMKPYIIDKILTANDGLVSETKPTECGDLIEPWESTTITEYMRAVVTNGTGKAFRNTEYKVAGKTGSAQYDSSDKYHSWFTGFAPYDDPEVAICVILEGGYSNVSAAQYVARDVLNEYFKE